MQFANLPHYSPAYSARQSGLSEKEREGGGGWLMPLRGQAPVTPNSLILRQLIFASPYKRHTRLWRVPLRISLYNRALYSLVIPRYLFSEICYFKIEAFFNPFNFYDTAGYSLHTKPTDNIIIIIWHRSVLKCSSERLSYVETGTFAGVEECAEANSLCGAEKIGEFAVTIRSIVSAVLRAAQMEPLPSAFSEVG